MKAKVFQEHLEKNIIPFWNKMADYEKGGFYGYADSDGKLEDTTKHTYNQAFAIYALSVYYQASGKKEALNLAYSLYQIIESKCRDNDGYFEAFSRDFSPVSNEKLSEI